MILSNVEAVAVNSKKSTSDVGVRTSRGERCGFGALAPSLTRASSMSFSGGKGSALLPNLVKLTESSLI